MKRVLALRSRYGTGDRELTDIDKYLELSAYKDVVGPQLARCDSGSLVTPSSQP